MSFSVKLYNDTLVKTQSLHEFCFSIQDTGTFVKIVIHYFK